MNKGLKLLTSIIILVIIGFVFFVFAGSQIYTDWLWFKNLGYVKTFMVMFLSNFTIRLVIGAIFTLFIFVNLIFTRKVFLNFINIKSDDQVESLFGGRHDGLFKWLNKKRITYLYLLGSIILGFLFSSINQDVWKIVLKYINKTPFNSVDPIFSKDISFYVFSLPFFSFIKEMGMVLVILNIIIIGIIYIIASGISSFKELNLKLSDRAKSHITVLLIIFLLLKAWDYRINMYNLLYSSRGVVLGASYTDINANLLGLKALFVIVFLVSIILFISLFRKNYKFLVYGLGLWLITSIIFGNIYPGFVQRFQVEPNEIAKESKYIKYNIDMTLKAYNLNNIDTMKFEVNNKLTQKSLEDNKEIINNIRLWDQSPLRSTYSQLQELRQYYNFVNVDIDRYYINDEYRQVMLAAREMNQNLLSGQAKTWINQTLKYTHGYGIVMSPVNKVTTEGLPEFFIKDIPPKIDVDIPLNNSSIYYGEKTDNYIISNSRSKEFHYPMGAENVYINYDGKGGVELNNYLKKIIYAIKFGNMKLLLAGDINIESRIMYNRNIKERVRKVAPFLEFDRDPYLVIANGKLFWVQDAYTTTNRYPYSQSIGNMGNYIRNSIKIVIDAYNGSMKFYVVDKNDPLANTYMKIFPDLFASAENIDKDIKKHLRYPKDLFIIQAQLYSTYHMKNPTVFYNKEDHWNVPTENYSGNSIQMEPYYIISQLPDEEKTEFILMLPFTPATKNNMIAWMAARSDGENYGDLLVYNFPKDKLVYGPMQIESRIDQDSDISQLLTLWSQRGSRVIRGNLLVIPIEQSLLYIEPIYLQAETSELPELKRVVVGYGDQIVMKENLDLALQEIFGQIPEKKVEKYKEDIKYDKDNIIIDTNINELTNRALNLYNQALENQREGNWSEYGRLIKELENILIQIQDLNKNK